MKREKAFRPDRIGSYFRVEWLPLALVTLSGLIYNIGLLATPWFEGRLAQCLADILGGNAAAGKMAVLVLAYILVTLGVQAARFIKPLLAVTFLAIRVQTDPFFKTTSVCHADYFMIQKLLHMRNYGSFRIFRTRCILH